MPQKSLLRKNKLFVKPYVDYGDITYDQSYVNTYHQRMESIQCKIPLALTNVIRSYSNDKRIMFGIPIATAIV